MQAQTTTAAKKTIRQRVVAMRDALSIRERSQQSGAITAHLLALPAFAQAQTVAAYASFKSELDTDEFLKAVLQQGKRLLLPRIDPERRELSFFLVSNLGDSFLAGPWGIREPDPARCVEAEMSEIDFMLVPGVAFTRRCERLGYGGGFYDAAIGNTRDDAAKVAAAFDVQIVDALPVEPHDRRVELVVTQGAFFPVE
ncbi:MAG TPA: 5-formyltetrahydrofolate cyclo-ligase [Burkholderiales bacterium]|nr:5-formyltetrahydrofolate cyclo-ligase [Burkholderiales bacterium]